MPLAAGTRLGPYEVVSPLGAGGMGEVYRARDTKLQRDVAIKVLPEHLASDRDRLARFEREAQVLASLNHPHIAHIYGFEQSGPTHALVLELVEGDTLAERIAAGPLPADEALPIALQIAQALEAAHEQGIVHRDLKPANIKITPAGTVKVLDFGLARLTEAAGSGDSALSMSPTITSPAMTVAGVVLGTAAYMSPEQARGKSVNRQADIWAFGCVLFEMLSGRRLFEAGDSISDVIAAILKNEPDWSLLPVAVPATVRTLLRRCLQKDPQKRLPHIDLVRIELEDPSFAVESTSCPQRTALRVVPVLAAAILAGAVVGFVMWAMRPAPPAARVLRSQIPIPPGDRAVRRLALSPDGTRLAFVAENRLYIRSLSEFEAKPVPGAEISQGYIGDPVFSPDGESLAYWTGNTGNGILKRIPISGGAPVTLYGGSFSSGTSWGESGLVFAAPPGKLIRLPPDGSAPQTIVTASSGELVSSPQMLPGGNAVLFTLARSGEAGDLPQETWDRARVVVQQLGSGQRNTVIDGGSDARYLPTGHLMYAVGSTLYAVPFDVTQLKKTGPPVTVLTGVGRTLFGDADFGRTQLSVANDGTIAYLADTRDSGPGRLAMVDRVTGKTTLLNGPAANYAHPRVSPSGKQVAVGVEDSDRRVNIWIYDIAGATSPRQLTFEGSNRNPVWSVDGAWIAFQSDVDGDRGIFRQRADGSARAERLTTPEKGTEHVPGAFAPDGTLLFSVRPFLAPQGATRTLQMLRDGKVQPFGGVVTNAVFAIGPAFSPDGKWVAYTATTTPRDAVVNTWVQPFPPTGPKYPVGGEGIQPLWSRDGSELFVQEVSQLVARHVSTSPTVTFSDPNPVPNVMLRVIGIGVERNYDILPDGRFLGVVGEAAAGARAQSLVTAAQIHVVVNWFDELRRLVTKK